MQKIKKIAILASGSGTNAENIILHFKSKKIAEVVLVATENSNAYVIERAKKLSVEHLVFSMSQLRNGYLLNKLMVLEVDFVVLAGFLKLVPEPIIEAFHNRIVNIHPALLPKYGGKGMFGHHVHVAVIENGEKESGITIHYVNGVYDSGDIIFQAKCEVNPTDTPDTLAQKIHELEQKYFPSIIEKSLDF